MRPLYPSLTLNLPEDWNIITPSGPFKCRRAQLLVESQEKVLPPDWQSKKKSSPLRHQLSGVALLFQGTLGSWKRIQKDQLFGYHHDRSGPIFGGTFNPNQPYFFEAHLRSAPLTLLSLMNEHLSQLRTTLLQSSIAQDLRTEQSYKLLSVTQSLPSNPDIRTGMTLNWGTDP